MFPPGRAYGRIGRGMPSAEEIRRLVAICQESDLAPGSEADAAEAWGTLFAWFHPRVLGICGRLAPGKGEDMASDVMMKARFRLETFDRSRDFGSWLYRIAANRCWDEVRASRRDEPLDDARMDAMESTAPTPLDRLLAAERRNRITGAIQALPLRQRFAVTLRYGADLGYERIAETLGVSKNHVGVLLLRARRRLRDILREETA